MDQSLLKGLCGADCPVARANVVFGGKWTSLILRDLISGTKRYSELQRSLVGISPKMLADRLDLLRSEGLISKTIHPVVPPRTEYTLTRLGRQVIPTIAAMAQLGRRLQKRDVAGS